MIVLIALLYSCKTVGSAMMRWMQQVVVVVLRSVHVIPLTLPTTTLLSFISFQRPPTI